MNNQEITLGTVTYEIYRVYSGKRLASELVVDRLSEPNEPDPSFDERPRYVL